MSLPPRRAFLLAASALLLPAPPLTAQAFPTNVHEVEGLADGSILITDGGGPTGTPGGIVFQVHPAEGLVHAWQARTSWTHSAEATGGGAVLVTDTGNDRVLEIDADGTILWDSDAVSPLSDGSVLRYPNDAKALPGGSILICDRDNHRVLEIDHAGTVLWQHGTTGVPGGGAARLRQPHNPQRLASGNTLIADSSNDRVIEVDAAGALVWEFGGAGVLDWPRDVDEIAPGERLITDSRHARLLRVDLAGTVLATIPTDPMPYEADALPSGGYLVGGGSAYQLDAAGTKLWSWPDAAAPVVVATTVFNPSTGVNLAVTLHLPAGASAAAPRPALVQVPGGSGAGGGFYAECEKWARLGWVAVHFDPDGRGASTNGGTYTVEDYCGFLQQDGLREVLRALAARPEVDPARLVIYTHSYGITMGSGTLARYPDDPPVAILADWEGPASRDETASVNGGHVPVDPGNDPYWAEREAITFMPAVRASYLRLQSEMDHHPPHPGNFHAIDLANAALAPLFGGGGAAPQVTVDGELDNAPNRVWSLADPPAWIPETLDADPYRGCRAQREFERLLAAPRLTVSGVLAPGGVALIDLAAGPARAGFGFWFAAAAGTGPTARPGGGWASLSPDAVFAATFRSGTLDAAGDAALTLAIPPNPALSGRTFAAQALVLEASRPVPTAASAAVAVVLS